MKHTPIQHKVNLVVLLWISNNKYQDISYYFYEFTWFNLTEIINSVKINILK